MWNGSIRFHQGKQQRSEDMFSTVRLKTGRMDRRRMLKESIGSADNVGADDSCRASSSFILQKICLHSFRLLFPRFAHTHHGSDSVSIAMPNLSWFPVFPVTKCGN